MGAAAVGELEVGQQLVDSGLPLGDGNPVGGVPHRERAQTTEGFLL